MKTLADILRIGSNLRRIRKSHGLTQAQMGEILGVSCATVARYENGNIALSVEKLSKIIEALNVEVSDLISLKRGGIFIPNMEQPGMCAECPFLKTSYLMDVGIYIFCCPLLRKEIRITDSRDNDCPLREE